jgi:hypothetical protein
MPVKINAVFSGGNMTMTRHLTCAAIVVALFCAAKPTLSELTAEDTQKLSNDVLSAIEGNQAMLDSLHTILGNPHKEQQEYTLLWQRQNKKNNRELDHERTE